MVLYEKGLVWYWYPNTGGEDKREKDQVNLALLDLTENEGISMY